MGETSSSCLHHTRPLTGTANPGNSQWQQSQLNPCHSSPLPCRAHSACTWQGAVHLQALALPRAKRRVKKSFPLSKLPFWKGFAPSSPPRPRWLSGTGDSLALLLFIKPKVLQHLPCIPPAKLLHQLSLCILSFLQDLGKKKIKNHTLLPLVTT